MNEKSSSTSERFAVTEADNYLGAVSEPSTQLLAELIDYLRAQGDEQDAGLALALESQGWGVLTAAQIQTLLQQFKVLAQGDAQKLAQANVNDTQGNVTITDGAASSAALPALKPLADQAKGTSEAPAPAPSSSSQSAPSFAGQIMEFLSRSEFVVPSKSGQNSTIESSSTASNANTTSFGSSILSGLNSGQFPGVSASTLIERNASAPSSVSGLQVPPVAAPVTAPTPLGVVSRLASASGSESGPSSLTSSSAEVSRMPATDSLGGSAELNNAASITPYVEQKITLAGSLVSAPVVKGSTESGNTKASTSYVRPAFADVLGGAVPIATVKETTAPVPADVPRPPDPFGNVTLSFHKSMKDSSQVQNGDNANLDLPRKIQEGTSPDGATPIHLLVSRVNPLMPDDIPFVITGLNGRDDVISATFGATEINQSQITFTVDADGKTIRGKVHFEGGQTDKVLTINIIQDATVETLETMSVALDKGTFGLLLSGNHAVVMNLQNDDLAVVSVTANAPTYDGPGANDTLPQVVEGTGAETEFTLVSFTVTRTVPATHGNETTGGVPLLADRIDWSVLTTGAGNISAADIHASDLSGQIQFAVGEMSRVVTIRVLKDAVREDSAENLTLNLSAANATYSVLGTQTATTRIADDDGLVSIALATGQAAVEDEGSNNVGANAAHTLTFTVTRTNSLMADNFAYSIGGISQDDLLQGNLAGNTVSFAAGETSKNITVVLRKDFILEANETVTVALADGTYAQVKANNGSAGVLITNDDDLQVGIQAVNVAVWEGNDSNPQDNTLETTNLAFTVTRSKPVGVDDSEGWPEDDVVWSVLDPQGQIVLAQGMSRDPVSGMVSGVVHFAAQAPGSASQSVDLVLQTDRNGVQESDWLAEVSLDATEYTQVKEDAAHASTWVLDDDPTIAVDPNPPTVLEGGNLVFTIRRTTALDMAFDVEFQLVPTSGGADYIVQPTNFVRHFAAGQDTLEISVATANDGIVNDPRQVVMNITGVRNLEDAEGHAMTGRVYVEAGSSAGSITNDDAEISIDSIIASAPDTDGFVTFTVSVTREGAQAFKHGVKWSVVGMGENPLDPNEVVNTAANHNILFEVDGPETQTFTFKAPAGLIIDGSRTFEVRLQDLSANDVTDGSDIAIRTGLGVDAMRGTVIPNGVSVSVVPVLTNLAEGSNGAGATHTFAVKLSEPSTEDIVIGWHVSSYGSSSDAATASDFSGGQWPLGTITIPHGTTQYTFQFSPNADAALELTEKFLVGIEVISGPAGVVGVQARGSIVNDDAQIGFATAQEVFSVNEGMDGVVTMLKADVVRSGFARSEVSVAWRVELIDDSATPAEQRAAYADLFGVQDADHLPSGRVNILAGQSLGRIEIPVFGDNTLEASEKFRIVLLDGAEPNDLRGGATLVSANTVATGVIVNDDAIISMDVATYEVTEGQGGSKIVTLTVVRDSQGEHLPAATVQWLASANGTGASYADKTDFVGSKFPSGTATFAAGSNVATISFTVNADDLLESVESFVVSVIGTGTAQHSLNSDASKLSTTVTLINDDDLVSFSTVGGNLSQSVVEDGNAHIGQTITYNLTRSGDLTKATTVVWHLDFSGKTASASDFADAQGDAYDDEASVTGTAVFEANSATATIVLHPVKDITPEADQTFAVVLDTTGLSANGTRLATSNTAANGTLINDDVEVAVVESSSVTESATGTVTITFTVSRSGDTANQATDLTWTVNGSTIVVNGLRMADALSSGEFSVADNDSNSTDPVLHWAAGDVSTRTITVTVNGDLVVEGDEAVKLTLANTGSAPVADLSNANDKTVLVHDNDARVWVEALETSVTEGKTGESHNVTFRVYRDGDIASGLSVALSHSGASGVTGPTVATFPAAGVNTEYLNNAMTRQYVDVTYAVAGDNILETGEALQLTLGALTSSPSFNAALDTARAVAQTTIANDDNAITVSSNVTQLNEGATTGSPANPHNTVTFTLTRDDAGKLEANTVQWRLAGSGQNQVNELDFDPGQESQNLPNNGLPSGTVSFASGARTATVTVILAGDLTIEPNEGMKLVLTAPNAAGNLQVVNPDYTVKVLGDDVGISVLPRDAELLEGNDATIVRTVSFDVARVGSNNSSSLYWKLIPDSNANSVDATASDFANGQATTGQLVFDSNGGALVQLNILQDSLEEQDLFKTVTIGLYSDEACQIPVTTDGNVHYTATTVLKDDDATLTLVASSGASVYEGSDPDLAHTDITAPFTDDFTTLTFTVNRTGNTDQVSEVPWSVALTNGLTAEDFYDGLTSGTITFPGDGTVAKTITLKVKKDWLAESDETVTVALGTPSAGTSLAGGSQSESTTVLNDDVMVQFASGSLAVSHSEGDSGATVFSFVLSRTGDTAHQASTVTWMIQPHDSLNSADFATGRSELPSTGLTYSYDTWNNMPTGTATFAAGETSKTVNVYVNADTFSKEQWGGWYYPFTQGSKLEADEVFTVALQNGSTDYSSRNHYAANTPSIGTVIGAQNQAVGTIVNDDIKIQITDIHTNLAEGTAPDVNGDVDPAHQGVQTYIEQSITFERTGDLTQAVGFNWAVNTANFSSQMMAGQLDHGRVSFAAGDRFATITFHPQGDDTVEPNYTFTLEVTAADAGIDEFSFGTATGVVVNRNPGELPLATFNVMRDEAGVWISNEMVTSYNNWDSQESAPVDTYSAGDDHYGNGVYGPGDTRNINYAGPDASTLEGSLGTAQSGSDYTAVPLTTLTFTADNRSQTVTFAINDDGTYETREGMSLFLNGAQHATVADSESLVTIVDNDNSAPTYQVNVTGSTGIEGIDDHIGFTVELGKSLTQASTFEIDLSSNSQASVSRDSGEAGDVSRYFEYSTDGGDTWQTNAPVFDFTYTSGNRQAVDDQLTVAYDFNNNNNGNSWDSWLEFSDLKAGVAGQRVGNTLTGMSHGAPAPSLMDVVVNSQGGWIDTDGDRNWDNNEQEAFDWWGNDQVDLSQNSVSITFIQAPNNTVDLSGFGLDDRISIDYGRFHDGSYSRYDGTHYVESANGTGGVTWFDWFKGFTSDGGGGLRDSYAFAVGGYDSNELYLLGCSSGCTSRYDTLAHNTGNDNNLSQQEIFDRVSFVNVGEREIASSVVSGAQQLSVWIAVRADASVNADDLSLKISGSGGDMQGNVGGVLDLSHVVSGADQALRTEFVAWWNDAFNNSYAPETDEDWADFNAAVNGHFDAFAARLTDAPALQFVQVQVDWDGYGQMSWSVEGLDPTVVLAPQNDSPFGGLQLLQDITVNADTTSASADVALGAQATFDTHNGMTAVVALERDGLQPGFEVLSDETDADGVRTVTMKVTRPGELGEDVLRYDANFPAELTDARLLSGSDPLTGRVAFANGQTEAELVFRFNAVIDDYAPLRDLPLKLSVIVDHNPNDATGAVGAYIDTDRDGVLDANEAVESNLAFSASGEDLVGVSARSVTVRFNDFMDNPLDLSGFGGDDRIEINLDELSRNWKVGTVTEYSYTQDGSNTIRDGGASTSWELTGHTVLGRDFDISLYAERGCLSSNTTAYMDFSGCHLTSNGSNWNTMVLANFGSGQGQNPVIDGYLSLSNQVSFVKNPTVHVVVDHYLNADGQDTVGAFIDLDKDGVLDTNEATADNLAFNADGSEAHVDLRHAPVVLHFNDAPAAALDLLNFGRDDRIEIDVGAFRANGWAIAAADAGYEKAWSYLDGGSISGDAAAALVFANSNGGNAQDFLGVHGSYCYSSNHNSIWLDLAAGGGHRLADLGSFGNAEGSHRNDMVEHNAIWGKVSFVNINGTPAQDIHVVVDHYDNSGNDAVGAFIDLDQDGVLDANEATQDNLAFNADGTANINLAVNHVTVQFNDAPDVALDFAGFGADDRIEVNLNQFAANGWVIPEKLTSAEFSRRTAGNTYDYNNCTWVALPNNCYSTYDLSGYSAVGQGATISLIADTAHREFNAKNRFHTANGSAHYNTQQLVQFSDGYQEIGDSQLMVQQVSYVRDPVVHVVVEKSGAYFDLNADGRLNDNEANADNSATAEHGLDLAHQSVVVRINDIPQNAIDLTGFGRDDRIEVDVSRLGMLGAFDVNRDFSDTSYSNAWNCATSDSYGHRWNTTQTSRMVAEQANDSLAVKFSRTYHHRTTRHTSEGSTTGFSASYSYGNFMLVNGSRVANFGENRAGISGSTADSNLQTAQNWAHNDQNPYHLIDANGGMINRVSFVSSTQQVLITADGGWIDRDVDGVLDTQEQTDGNRAFAADGSALINLHDNSYVLRFLDAPENTLDLSGFNRDDRIEIDRSQLAAHGFLGADNSANSNSSTPGSYATKMQVSGDSGALAVWAGEVFSSNGLFLLGHTSESGTKAILGDFGPDNVTGGEGDLSGRLSFVQSTIHVVVESYGAYLDENANGKLDGNESTTVFDPFSGDALINLSNHKVVIKFNDVPDAAIDLSGFGSDDRIDIDRGAFHKAGWGGANATHTVQNWWNSCSSGDRGFNNGSSQSRFVLSLSNGDLALSAATKWIPSHSGQLAYGLGNEEGNPESLLNNNVSFVASKFISGFGGDHAISLNQGGSLSSGGMQSGNTITAGPGTDKILIRAPIVNDNIDEKVETISLTVTQQTGNEFTVPSSSGTSTLVDDDSPQIDMGTNVLNDGQLQQYFVVKTIDINNRSSEPSPHTGYGSYTNGNTPGDDAHYYSDSLSHDAGAAQSFTVSMRFQGQWELALIDEVMAPTGQGYVSTDVLNPNVTSYTDAMHNSAPPFLPITGVAELDADGVLTGYFLYDVHVPAGTKQILMRSAVAGGDLTDPEIAVRDSFSADITHVDPIIVARDVLVDENAGTATVEVIAVGGDIGHNGVSVNVQTADGQWVDRTFIVSREYATVGELTLHWSVEALGGAGQSVLVDNAAEEYVSGYFAQNRVGSVNANDFVLLDGQLAGSTTRSPGLPTGTVTFAEGQKEAHITVRVRADNVGEEKEDFRMVLDQPPAGVQLLGNPSAPQTYAAHFDAAGYARINNDDQLFVVEGVVINESKHSKVMGEFNSYDQTDGSGMAIDGTPANMTAPVGYTLHQFIITREGDARAAASVDYAFQVKGIDVAGFIETTTLADQGAGAHQAEKADFLAGGAYGFAWGSAVNGVTSSVAKTVVFAAGESQKVITFAVADDALVEDAEQFRVVLTNAQALPGNDGNPGVSELRGAADFLIGDNEGTTVSVSIGWLDGATDPSVNALSNDLGNAQVDNAFYEGTSSDWLTTGNNDDSNNDLANDRLLVLTFTRSNADATASQAFFEIDLSRSNWGARDMVLASGSVSMQDNYQSSSWWRGTVDFAPGATTATVTFRVPDDNVIEPNQTLSVTLYDAEHLPESRGTTHYAFNGDDPSTAGNDPATLADTAGIGDHAALPDWNTTIRDPNAYQATATVVNDDIRLWLGGFRSYHNGNTSAYDWTPDGDTDTGISNADAWEAYTLTEGNPTDAYTDDQAYTSGNGDFELSFGRAGVQSGDIQLNWTVVLGTADYADFNSAYWVDAQGDHTTVLADVAGVKGSVTLAGSSSTSSETTFNTTIQQLLAVERGVENNETFQLTFSVDGSPSHVLFTPNYANEAPNSSYYSSVLQGHGTMTVDMVALNDDVVYGISLASTEADNRVTEGDGVSSTIKFDLTRELGSTVTGGFHGSSTVGWRIVAVNGYDIKADDFVDGLTGSVGFDGQYWNGSTWVRPVDVSNQPSGTDVHQVLTININPDSEVEYGEHFTIELYDPSVGYVDAAHSSVEAVIVNDDTGVLINNFSVTEGDTGTSTIAATVIRVGDLSGSSTFNWAKYNVDTNSTDFDATGATTGSATIGANSTATVVDGFGVETYTLNTTVKLKGDAPAVPNAPVGSLTGAASVEDNERFRLVLDKDSGIDQMLAKDQLVTDTAAATESALNAGTYVLSSTTSASAFGTVLNDDTIFSVAPVTVSRDESSGSAYTFTVTRSVATPQDQTVTWSVLAEGGRNVVNAADFGGALPTGTITFSGSELSKTITVAAPNADSDPEADEVFMVKVTALGTGAENDMSVTTGAGAKGVIVNDDAAIYINDSQPITQMEGSGATQQTYKFDVVRSGLNVTGTSTVDWKVQLTANGAGSTAQIGDFATLPTTSTASGWYDAANNCIRGTVTFAADSYDLQTVSLALNPDGTKESTESFVISLDNPSAGSIVASSNNATGNIGDDDFDLTVKMDGIEGVDFGTLTALSPVSYNGVTYAMYSWNGAGVTITSATDVLKIQPWYVSNFSYSTPVVSTTAYNVWWNLPNNVQYQQFAAINIVTPGYMTVVGNGNGPNDYSLGSYGNGGPNLNSLFASGSYGLLISTLPITAPDEGDGNANMQFTVTRDGATDLPANATWTLVFGSNNAAALAAGMNYSGAAGFADSSDFRAVTGNFVFPAGASTYTFTVPINGDLQWEENEVFTVRMDYDRNNGTSGTAWAKAALTNDDEGFSVATIADANEGSTDVPGSITIRVVREGNLEGSSTVDWAISTSGAHGVTTTGTSNDFMQALRGTVSFDGTEASFNAANGQKYSYKDVTVALKGDAVYETDETYTVTLSNAGEGSSIKTATAVGKIVNDDMGYFVAVKNGQTEVVEGNVGESVGTTPVGTPPGTVTFVVRRECDPTTLGIESTVAWRLSAASGDATAVQAADVSVSGTNVVANGLTGTVTFGANELTKEITITLVGDGVHESAASLAMTLSRAAGDTSSTMVTPTASVTLTDDDDTLSISTLTSSAVAEGNIPSAYTAFDYAVTRTGSALGVATVDWSVAAAGAHAIQQDDIDSVWVDGVSVSTSDFANGTLTWGAGDLADKLIQVRVKNDRMGEWDEQFALALANSSYGSNLGTANVIQTVVNDDPALMLSMSNTRITEGNDEASGTSFTFVVTRSGDITGRSTVHWQVESASSELNELDFGGLFPSGTVVFDGGEQSKTVTVLTGGDVQVEGNEDFRIVLSNATNADVVGPDSVLATIVDDDVAVSVRSVSGTVVEGADGTDVTYKFAAEAKGPNTATRAVVSWHVEGAGEHPTIGNDFSLGSLPQGQTEIVLRQGQGYAFIDISIAGDNVYGPDEQFKIVIDDVAAYAGSTPMGASATISEAIGTVQDDDLLIGLVQQTAEVVEGAEGDYTHVKFYVEALSDSNQGPSMEQVRVDYHVSGTVNNEDFDGALSGTDVALSYDSDGYYLELVVKGDINLEDHEQFKLQIDRAYAVDSGGNVEVSDAQAFVTGRILGDDYGIQLATVTTAQNEDSARFNFELIRLGPIDVAMDVQLQVGAPLGYSGSGVVSRDDFINLNGFTLSSDGVLTKTVHFDAGEGTTRFELEAAHDLRSEGNERFTVMASVDAVDGASVMPTADEVTSIDCWIYDESSDMLAASNDPMLHTVVDHSV